MQRKLIGALGVWLLAFGAVVAADFWEDKEFTSWSDREVQRMMTDSPWAKQVNIIMGGLQAEESSQFTGGGFGVGGGGGGAVRGGRGGDGFGGIRRARVNVVWINALPVRQAMVRGLVGRGGDVPPEGEQFLSEQDPFYTIAILGLPPAFQALGQMVNQVLAETMLKPDDGDPIPPIDIGFMREGDQSIRVMFMFPRDNPLTLDDREVEFITKLGSEIEIKRKFRLRDMQVDGRLLL